MILHNYRYIQGLIQLFEDILCLSHPSDYFMRLAHAFLIMV